MDANAGHDEPNRTDPDTRQDEVSPAGAEGGVLGSLPRTRPQRASPRRAAERTRAAKQASARKTAAERSASTRKATATNASRPTKKRPAPRDEPPAPKQGYEPEDDLELGRGVNPPSGIELVGSVADILIELAGAGLKAGRRALKDALSPLSRS